MPILSMTSGKVTRIWGAAYYKQPDGSLLPVRVGDELVTGQQILTDQKGIVEIEPKALSPKILKLIEAANEADHKTTSLAHKDLNVAPAAGMESTFHGSLLPGLRVERVAETTTPNVFGMPALSSEDPGTTPTSVLFDNPLGDEEGLEVVDPGAPTVPPEILVPPVSEKPGVQILNLTVSEGALAGGRPDDTGSPDTSNSAIQIVNVDLSLLDNTAGLHLVAPATPLFTADGRPLVWASDGHGGLVATAGSSTGAAAVVTAAVDATTGQITVTLLAPLQHSAAGEDALTLNLDVRTTASGDDNVASLTVAVEDDAPVVDFSPTLTTTYPGTNLMIVLDTSAGMAQRVGPTGQTRLQEAVQAIDHMLDDYAGKGPVAVRLVAMAGASHTVGDQWLSVDAAKALLETMVPKGGLQYDQALLTAATAFSTEAGRLPGAQNESYLFAGNVPSLDPMRPAGAPLPPPTYGQIDAAEEAAWNSFLKDHHIVSHVVGWGGQVVSSDLDRMAYDGAANANRDAVVVDTLADWSPTVPETLLSTVHGSLLTGLAMGADGFSRINNVVVDGLSHVAGPNADVISVHTALGGDLVVNTKTGEYTYTPPVGVAGVATETFAFTAQDKDGDTVSSTWNVVLKPIETVHSTPVSDVLTGRVGTDVFTWHLSDAHAGVGGAASASVDHVQGFQVGSVDQAGADVLDLRDLLQGEHAGAGLDRYLSVDSGLSGSTLHISTAGKFDGVHPVAELQDHAIVLDGVNLHTSLGLAPDVASMLVIQLLAQGQLKVDA